jgi:hypothetical protein
MPLIVPKSNGNLAGNRISVLKKASAGLWTGIFPIPHGLTVSAAGNISAGLNKIIL